MIKFLRVALATAIGVPLTGVMAVWMIVTGDRKGSGRWVRWIEYICMQGILGISYEIDGDIDLAEENEFVVFYANHQASLGLSSFGLYIEMITQGKYAQFISKSDLYPLVKYAVERSDAALIVNREDPVLARQQISDALPDLIARNKAVVIFADSSRWTKKGADKLKKKFSDIPGIEEMLLDVLLPRAGGLLHILEEIGDRPVRIIEIANGFKDQQQSIYDIMTLVDSEFHIMAEEIDPASIPRETAEFTDWLNNRFLLMARKLRIVREGRPVGAEKKLSDVA